MTKPKLSAREILAGPTPGAKHQAAHRQLLSALRFAHSAWDAALDRQVPKMGALAHSALCNLAEAARILDTNELGIIGELQRLDDWLEANGCIGIRQPVRTDEGKMTSMRRTADQLIAHMRLYVQALADLEKKRKAEKEKAANNDK